MWRRGGKAGAVAVLAVATLLVVRAALGPGPAPRRTEEDQARADRFLELRWRREPILGGGVPGTAFSHYDRFLSRDGEIYERPDEGEWETLYDLARSYPDEAAEHTEAFRDLIGAESPIFDELLLGARAEVVSPPAWGYDPSEKLGAAIRQARLVAASAPFVARRGRPDLALDRLFALDRFARDLLSCGTLLEGVVAMSLSEVSLKRLGDLATAGLLPDPQIERIEAFVKASRDFVLPQRRVFEATQIEETHCFPELWSDYPSSQLATVLQLLGVQPDEDLSARAWLVVASRTRAALEEHVRDAEDPLSALCEELARADRGESTVGPAAAFNTPVRLWPRWLAEFEKRRTRCDGLLLGIRLLREAKPVSVWAEALPEGWQLLPISDPEEEGRLGLYPPGKTGDEWVVRLPPGIDPSGLGSSASLRLAASHVMLCPYEAHDSYA